MDAEATNNICRIPLTCNLTTRPDSSFVWNATAAWSTVMGHGVAQRGVGLKEPRFLPVPITSGSPYAITQPVYSSFLGHGDKIR